MKRKKGSIVSLVMVIASLIMACGGGGASDQETAAIQLVVMGPPGAGKGTQARKIKEKYGIPHISTGDILRAEVARGTELGKQVAGVMERGELVADDIVLDLVDARIAESDCDNGFILDGFPRTIPQAEGLQTILEKQGKGPVTVIDIAVPDDKLTARLLARKRADDTEETIRNRIEVYHRATAPLIEFYTNRTTLLRVNGDQTIDDVFREIVTKLGVEE